jgi:predicted negative regulator of RcsB-dependent stress response
MSNGSKTHPPDPAVSGPVHGPSSPLDRAPEAFGPTEMDLIWEKHKGTIIAVLLAVLIAVVGYNVWLLQKQARTREAQQRFAAAQGEADYRQIAQDFPGGAVGGNALLLLASEQVDKKDLAAARATYEELAQKFPAHPLAPAALYAIAGLQENEGKLDEALARYKQIAKDYPGSFVEDAALRGEARVLVAKGDLDAARGIYQQIIGKAAEGSPARQSAEDELKLLNRHGEQFSEIQYTDPNPVPAAPDIKSPFPVPAIPGVDGLQGNTLNINPESTPDEVRDILKSAILNAAGDAADPAAGDAPQPAPPVPAPAPEPAAIPAPETGASTTATTTTTGKTAPAGETTGTTAPQPQP